MEKHYLTPLFAPQSIIVFAGCTDSPETMTHQARTLVASLKSQEFAGTLRFLDIQSTGTLADLAQARADLAIIALPPQDVTAALEIAGRIACRAALIVSSGISAAQASALAKIAKREGILLLGPNCLGVQRPALQLNASAAGPLAQRGAGVPIGRAHSLHARLGGQQCGGVLQRGVTGAAHQH